MTVQEAIEYINRHTWSQWKLGLSRTEELLKRLGSPQKRLRFIHVAGSNGKGSTCAMLERILREAGYRTGLYPSPYIEDFRERIQVNGTYITEEALCRITAQAAAQADAMEDHPSQFELITAIGMVYFAEQKCDFVVLEVGLGGTFDSTNVIDAPDAAVITNIGLEHTEYLGNTLAEIAAAKGGIIKSGSDVVCYESDAEVLRVIRDICAEKGCRLRIARHHEITPLGRDLTGQRFSARGRQYRLALLGEYQLRNVSTVLATVDVLRERGVVIPETAVEAGLSGVQWPARFEVLCREPLMILDGGHNPQCAQALAESLDAYLTGRKVTFLIGILADKDVESILRILEPYGEKYVCVTPDSPRAMPGEELARILRERGREAEAVTAVMREAVREALAAGNPVVAFGSLYLAGDVRRNYRIPCKEAQRKLALGRRRALTDAQRAEKSRMICEKLEAMPELQQAGTIFSYAAVWDEADLSTFHAWAAENGKRIAFPFVETGGVMHAAAPHGPDAWEEGPYGIQSPIKEKADPVPPEEIDAVLVPCVAFDAEGGRLGHGGGYYDRYLAELRAHSDRSPAVILIAFAEQELPKVVCEDTDVRVDKAVTA